MEKNTTTKESCTNDHPPPGTPSDGVSSANGYVSNICTHLDLTATRDMLGNGRYFTYDKLSTLKFGALHASVLKPIHGTL